jgi:putative transcriptional regulator
MDGPIVAGRLLVATPMIGDENFARTVVALLEHGDEGTLGLVLNRPTGTDLVDPLPEWGAWASRPPVVFAGGPVEQERAIGLARARATPAAQVLDDEVFQPLVGWVGTFDLTSDPELVGTGIEELRVFSGYAGWGADQLEAERATGAWWVLDAHPSDFLCDAPETLWRRVLARQADAELRRFALYPTDPRAN